MLAAHLRQRRVDDGVATGEARGDRPVFVSAVKRQHPFHDVGHVQRDLSGLGGAALVGERLGERDDLARLGVRLEQQLHHVAVRVG